VCAAVIASSSHANTSPEGGALAVWPPSSHANRANHIRNQAARARNRRSQPRAVVSGTPAAAATGLCPRPAAAITSASPIALARSILRATRNAGSSA